MVVCVSVIQCAFAHLFYCVLVVEEELKTRREKGSSLCSYVHIGLDFKNSKQIIAEGATSAIAHIH